MVLPRHRPTEPPRTIGSRIVSQAHGMRFLCFYISRGTHNPFHHRRTYSSSRCFKAARSAVLQLELRTLQSVELGAVMAQTGVMQRPWLWIAIVAVLVLQSANARLLTENNSPAVAVRKDEAANLDVLDLSAGRHLREVEAATEDGATGEVCMFEYSSPPANISLRFALFKNHTVELRTYHLLMLNVSGLRLDCNRANRVPL